MKNILKHFLILIFLIVVLVLPYFVFAKPSDLMKKTANDAGFATESSEADNLYIEILAKILNAFFGVLGIIFIFLIVLAGYNWMTASGKEEKVTRAIADIRRAVVGLIIIIGSYAIWNFVVKYFFTKE